MRGISFPSVRSDKTEIIFENGKYCNLPAEYYKSKNKQVLQEFYFKILIDDQADTEQLKYGVDPLGFSYFKLGFICYTGLVSHSSSPGKFGALKKKFPKNRFHHEFIVEHLRDEYDLLNYKKFIPIEIVTQNLHEIRGLNSKISGHVDILLNITDESKWEEEFDKKSEQVKKIFVASRLIKFILDNTKFYIPDFFKDLKIKHDRDFIVHRSVSKIVKIYSNDFKKDKCLIEFSGQSFTKITGEKEYFEILIKILIENATKYSLYADKFPPKISLTEANSQIIIEISSYGDLISVDERQHLFTKGFRSNANKSKQEGTGMGLYNASQLAIHFAGTITYSSRNASNKDSERPKGSITLGWNIFTLTIKKQVGI